MSVFKSVTITRPDDWHNHARVAAMMMAIVNFTARWFGRVVWMPNTLPPVTTGERAMEYKREIEAAATQANREFESVMTLKLTLSMTVEILQVAYKLGVRFIKYYPEGVTTNSTDGIHPKDLHKVYRVLAEMQRLDMVLCIHGEHPDYEVLDREAAFVPVLELLVHDFPDLKMVLEHVSTVDGVAAVSQLPATVAGTITAHHLGSTLTDMLGGHLEVHMNCKPVLKNKKDLAAVQSVAFSGNPKFMYGSDSAAHLRGAKETECCAAGGFTAPIALPMVTQLFYENSALDNLEAFTSLNGARFHGLEPNRDRLLLELREEEPFVPEVPSEDVVTFPFRRDADGNPMQFNWHVTELAA